MLKGKCDGQAQLQFRMALGGAGRMELVRTDWVTRHLSAEVATFIERCARPALDICSLLCSCLHDQEVKGPFPAQQENPLGVIWVDTPVSGCRRGLACI